MRTCNEKDMSVSSRYSERKDKAESFPTRAKSLPPLNSNHEKLLVLIGGKIPLNRIQSHKRSCFMKTRVEPRV